MIESVIDSSPLSSYIGSFFGSFDANQVGFALFSSAFFFWLAMGLLPQLVVISMLERKLLADMQMRVGPNRAGPFGIFQWAADAVKLASKSRNGAQISLPGDAALIFAVVATTGAVALLPLSANWTLVNVDSSLILALLFIAMAKFLLFWSEHQSESAWTILAAFRKVLPLALWLVSVICCAIPVVVMTGSGNLLQIGLSQGGMPWSWNAFGNPGMLLGFLGMLTSTFIFHKGSFLDPLEPGASFRGGSGKELSGSRLAIARGLEAVWLHFSLLLITTIYLGAWNTPFNLESFGRAADIVWFIFFLVKVAALGLLAIWIKGSLPKIRDDQFVNLCWRYIIPLGLGSAVLSLVWLVLLKGKQVTDLL